MNLGQFERQLGVLQRQVAALWSSAAREGAVLPPSIVDSFAALTQALAELQAADTEIRQQSTELARQQDVLEAARQHWHELFDLAPDGYLVTDLNGIILEANRSATELFSMPQEDLLGAPL
ncbi:MAG TPA: PAS domain-containing protein, partial [Anaerolineae bacterium]